MLKKYIEPEIEVLEITEHVFCADSNSQETNLIAQADEGEDVDLFVFSDEPAESTSPATENTPEPAPVEEAPVETESAETE
ncbi:MAG: hypothetical protein Q4B51_07615 [Coriobacteriaceae bacterium]|nr:hypothetical protein [Coriobacteriaceae bacterium]